MRILITALGVLAFAGGVGAAPVARPVTYKIGATEFRSVLVYDDASTTARPGLVMAPNWYGANDAAVEKAKLIAGQDYVILVADLFGSGVRPQDAKEAGATITPLYADRKLLRTRVNVALDTLKEQAGEAPLDTARLGAIGFCFGGSAVLDLARSGADIAGVVSFHGNLGTDDAGMARQIKGGVLVLNGANDSYVPAEQIAGFEKEMREAGVDYQFVNLAGAVHCFAEPDQKSPPGCVYNERAATRAFRMMRAHFAEMFAR